eukprot:TRINITY_DN330_c0_g1_i1.p1 TRINITY_DN330_c0_g1~~TRINITY_DN330_c0_g1_i1.p1  ORF type:complete len:134 (-),score=29.94 TRINITY_DN330_c0_g1_i1:359-760(-)
MEEALQQKQKALDAFRRNSETQRGLLDLQQQQLVADETDLRDRTLLVSKKLQAHNALSPRVHSGFICGCVRVCCVFFFVFLCCLCSLILFLYSFFLSFFSLKSFVGFDTVVVFAHLLHCHVSHMVYVFVLLIY